MEIWRELNPKLRCVYWSGLAVVARSLLTMLA
jgi:hypothetical protein